MKLYQIAADRIHPHGPTRKFSAPGFSTSAGAATTGEAVGGKNRPGTTTVPVVIGGAFLGAYDPSSIHPP